MYPLLAYQRVLLFKMLFMGCTCHVNLNSSPLSVTSVIQTALLGARWRKSVGHPSFFLCPGARWRNGVGHPSCFSLSRSSVAKRSGTPIVFFSVPELGGETAWDTHRFLLCPGARWRNGVGHPSFFCLSRSSVAKRRRTPIIFSLSRGSMAKKRETPTSPCLGFILLE